MGEALPSLRALSIAAVPAFKVGGGVAVVGGGILATLSSSQATVLGIIVALCIAILGGVIHTAVNTGRVVQSQRDHDRRLDGIEAEQDRHNLWHLEHEGER